jgi:flagellar assembly factor FliW
MTQSLFVFYIMQTFYISYLSESFYFIKLTWLDEYLSCHPDFECHRYLKLVRVSVHHGCQHARQVSHTKFSRRKTMLVTTSRFGRVDMRPDDVLLFPNGVLGLEDCRHWVLLADAHNEALGWLQSLTRQDVAFAVVSPRRYISDFQLRVSRSELTILSLEDLNSAQVLAIVGKNEEGITLNLRAPLVINEERRIGRQVIASNELPVQFSLAPEQKLRKSA